MQRDNLRKKLENTEGETYKSNIAFEKDTLIKRNCCNISTLSADNYKIVCFV